MFWSRANERALDHQHAAIGKGNCVPIRNPPDGVPRFRLRTRGAIGIFLQLEIRKVDVRDLCKGVRVEGGYPYSVQALRVVIYCDHAVGFWREDAPQQYIDWCWHLPQHRAARRVVDHSASRVEQSAAILDRPRIKKIIPRDHLRRGHAGGIQGQAIAVAREQFDVVGAKHAARRSPLNAA